MRLSRLAVSNYARLVDFEIRVEQHLVLVGPNEAGKSSVLRALNLLLGASTAALYAELTPDDFNDPDKALSVEVHLIDLDDDDMAHFPDEITVVTDGVSFLRLRLDAALDAGGSIEVRRSAPDGGHTRQLSRAQIARIGWRLAGARSVERDVASARNSSLSEILGAVDLGADAAVLQDLLDRYQAKIGASAALVDVRKQLAAQLTRALPLSMDQDDLAFVSAASSADQALADVELHVKTARGTHNIVEQSDGARALFAIALYDLVSSSANIVALDEPETHLHPVSQRSLARLLRTGKNQKILATHSTDIVSAFVPSQIVAIKPGGKLVQPQERFLEDDERMALRWWLRDRLEPLTANAVAAVEGISDRIVLEAAAELTGRPLERFGACIIETDGAGDMGAIVKLFGAAGFDVDLALLIDEDARTETAQKLGVAPADLTNHNVWISNAYLEDEYIAAIGVDQLWTAISNSGLFSPNELGNCTTTGPDGTRTADDLSRFCRKKPKYKTRSAIVVAKELTPATAVAMPSIEGLLSHLVS